MRVRNSAPGMSACFAQPALEPRRDAAAPSACRRRRAAGRARACSRRWRTARAGRTPRAARWRSSSGCRGPRSGRRSRSRLAVLLRRLRQEVLDLEGTERFVLAQRRRRPWRASDGMSRVGSAAAQHQQHDHHAEDRQQRVARWRTACRSRAPAPCSSPPPGSCRARRWSCARRRRCRTASPGGT